MVSSRRAPLLRLTCVVLMDSGTAATAAGSRAFSPCAPIRNFFATGSSSVRSSPASCDPAHRVSVETPLKLSLPVKLDNASFVGRMLRRFGRFGIAILSLVAFFVGGGIVYLFTALTMGVWFPKLCLLAAFGSAIGVYTIFDKLDLIPE